MVRNTWPRTWNKALRILSKTNSRRVGFHRGLRLGRLRCKLGLGLGKHEVPSVIGDGMPRVQSMTSSEVPEGLFESCDGAHKGSAKTDLECLGSRI